MTTVVRLAWPSFANLARLLRSTIALCCLLAQIGCSGQDVNAGHSASGPSGIWERVGYGDVLSVTRNQVATYQYTRATCYLAETIDDAEFSDLLTDIVIVEDGSTFTATAVDEPAFRRYYTRLASLPDVCGDDKRMKSFTPTMVFDHVWHTFNDYYAFFEERGVDWQAQYATYRSRVDDDLDKDALFAILEQLISPIDDGHIYLWSPSEDFSPEKPRGALAALRQEYWRQNRATGYWRFVSQAMDRYNQTIWDRLDEHRQLGGRDDDVFHWGSIGERVGYLRVESMSSIAGKRHSTSLDDVRATRNIMATIMADMRETDAMIVDVRFNGGGDDAVALAIANRFADERRLAITKTARSYLGETPRREAYLEPESDPPYLKPVVVIAGPDSASATEIFVMAMRALPHVTQVGEPTNGILSDELYKLLPQDWEFTLSNEVYYDHDGINHEFGGIVPHVHVGAFSVAGLEAGRDFALETALRILTE